MAICKSWGERPPKGGMKERKILPQPPFMVVRYLRNLAVLLNYRSQRSLIFTPNKHPRGTPILIGAGLAKPDRRGNIQVDGWRLRRSGHAEFSLPWGSSAASHFNSIDFHVTHRFFVTFFPEESNVPPSSPSPRSPSPFGNRRGHWQNS